jgi:hypothetical protein
MGIRGTLLSQKNRAILAEYLRTQDSNGSGSLLLWRDLRSLFPVLCGDPPPNRWIPDLFQWTIDTHSTDPSFLPVRYRFDWSFPDESLRNPSSLFSMEFLSRNPDPIQRNFSYVVRILLDESIRTLRLDVDTQS